MLVVVTSYRQNVRAYPSGGGDYEVATVNLGRTAGLVVASALLVDYVLTVAVSISSAASNIGSALPFVATHKVTFAVAAIILLTAANLRGIRESGTAFAIPTYAFMIGIIGMLAWGLIRVLLLGEHLRAESAGFGLRGEGSQLVGVALVFLVLRAFSSGCAALTGVEAISNGVPAFQKPKSRNAATTLLLLGSIVGDHADGSDRAGPAHRGENGRRTGATADRRTAAATRRRRWWRRSRRWSSTASRRRSTSSPGSPR